MDTIKEATAVLTEGITLLPDDAKVDFKAQAGEIFVHEAINNACGMVNEDPERIDMLSAYAVQEANRVVTTLWRLQLLPKELEKKYRKLPSMKELADRYNKWTTERKNRMDGIMAKHKAIAEEEKELDLFKGVINGLSKEESEKAYKQFEQRQQAAMSGNR